MKTKINVTKLIIAASFMAFDESAWPVMEDTDVSIAAGPAQSENSTQNTVIL